MGNDIYFTLYFIEICFDARFAKISTVSSGLPRIFVKYLQFVRVLPPKFLPNHSSSFLALEYY